jgi:Flp pilus assembly protein TadB
VTPTAVTWLALAAAIGVSGRGAVTTADPVRRAPASLRTLRLVAAFGAAVACVGVFGVGQGLPAAAVLVPVTVLTVTRVHARPPRVRPGPELPLALDLIAVALRAGRPLDAALLLAAPAAGPLADRFAKVGGLLRLGADPADAWSAVAGDEVLGPVAAAARRSSASGVRLAAAFEALAADVRARMRAAGEARAHKVGVLAAAPLGLCFLPSFVCLGIVPAVIGLARTSLMP